VPSYGGVLETWKEGDKQAAYHQKMQAYFKKKLLLHVMDFV
jgi:hypothetical protein